MASQFLSLFDKIVALAAKNSALVKQLAAAGLDETVMAPGMATAGGVKQHREVPFMRNTGLLSLVPQALAYTGVLLLPEPVSKTVLLVASAYLAMEAAESAKELYVKFRTGRESGHAHGPRGLVGNLIQKTGATLAPVFSTLTHPLKPLGQKIMRLMGQDESERRVAGEMLKIVGLLGVEMALIFSSGMAGASTALLVGSAAAAVIGATAVVFGGGTALLRLDNWAAHWQKSSLPAIRWLGNSVKNHESSIFNGLRILAVVALMGITGGILGHSLAENALSSSLGETVKHFLFHTGAGAVVTGGAAGASFLGGMHALHKVDLGLARAVFGPGTTEAPPEYGVPVPSPSILLPPPALAPAVAPAVAAAPGAQKTVRPRYTATQARQRIRDANQIPVSRLPEKKQAHAAQIRARLAQKYIRKTCLHAGKSMTARRPALAAARPAYTPALPRLRGPQAAFNTRPQSG